jgi:hypothetical protein
MNNPNNIETNNKDLLKIVKQLQQENIELRLSIIEISKNMAILSTTLAEKAVVQKFLVEQVAKTSEMVVEIDKILHPNSYIKFDLMNEPYN